MTSTTQTERNSNMIVTRTKKGEIKVHMEGELPTPEMLLELNTISNGFYIKQLPVSQALYHRVVGKQTGSPTHFECPLNETFTI